MDGLCSGSLSINNALDCFLDSKLQFSRQFLDELLVSVQRMQLLLQLATVFQLASYLVCLTLSLLDDIRVLSLKGDKKLTIFVSSSKICFLCMGIFDEIEVDQGNDEGLKVGKLGDILRGHVVATVFLM